MTAAAIPVVLAGVLIVWIAVRSWQGRLSRNFFAGVRTASTMRSDEAFRTANKIAAPFSAVGGLLFVVTGVVATVVPAHTASAVLLTGVLVAAIVMVAGAARGVRAVR
jgi:uncharacterized membrane protein